MRYILFIAVAVLAIFSCKPVKKVQILQTAIAKKDTATTVLVKEVPKVDSAIIVKNILDKTVNNRIVFTTFDAKVKVDYESAEDSKKFTAYFQMKKDSMIIIKLSGTFLGMSKVGAEVKITKDSVIIINRIDETVEYQTISYLQDVTKIPFDFYTLQDVIIGNPVFLNNNIVSYKNGSTQLSVLMIGSIFKHLLTLDNRDYKVLHSKLDDIDIMRNRSCDISFGTYVPLNGFQFATYRKISVAEKSELDVFLDFKEYSINEPLKYSFSIPKKYAIK